MSGLLSAFLVEVGLITFRSVRSGGTKVPTAAPISAPLPSLYTSAIFVYGALAILPDSIAPLPAMIGWGFVVATFLNLYNPAAANEGQASNASLAQSLGPSGTTPKITGTLP